MVKTLTYQHTNSYEIINPITTATKNIWICFHGLGYLSRYFKKYFNDFNSTENSIIIPQAPSKYYIGDQFKHVGACWLTREDTAQEMGNILNYLNHIITNEQIAGDPRIVIFGYSQGVSIATRFFRQYHYPIKALIMHSGSIPHEFTSLDADHFNTYCQRFIHISGKKDEYITPEIIQREKEKIQMLFGTICEKHRPDINHSVDSELLLTISQSL